MRCTLRLAIATVLILPSAAFAAPQLVRVPQDAKDIQAAINQRRHQVWRWRLSNSAASEQRRLRQGGERSRSAGRRRDASTSHS